MQRRQRMEVVEFEPWMKVPLSKAATGAVALRPHPIMLHGPSASRAMTDSTAVRDHGSWAPTSAQPTPSSSSNLARSRTVSGTALKSKLASQVAS
jgi:hypothetical protein